MKDPKKILIYAARSVDPAILGSSTACIVHIAEGTRLTSANLGDSGNVQLMIPVMMTDLLNRFYGRS